MIWCQRALDIVAHYGGEQGLLVGMARVQAGLADAGLRNDLLAARRIEPEPQEQARCGIKDAPIDIARVLGGWQAARAAPAAPAATRRRYRILYWGDADQPLDFTIKDDVADYAADARETSP